MSWSFSGRYLDQIASVGADRQRRQNGSIQEDGTDVSTRNTTIFSIDRIDLGIIVSDPAHTLNGANQICDRDVSSDRSVVLFTRVILDFLNKKEVWVSHEVRNVGGNVGHVR